MAPVWFAWEPGRVRIITGGASAKVVNLQHNPGVSLSIARDGRPYQYVVLEGEASITEDNLAQWVERICMRYDGTERGPAYARELLSEGGMVLIDLQVHRVVSWKDEE